MSNNAQTEIDGSTRDEISEILQLPPAEAASRLVTMPQDRALTLLRSINPPMAREILEAAPVAVRQAILAAASPENRRQWARHEEYPEGSVGRLMEAPIGVFSPGDTVAETIEALRSLVKTAFITYGFVTDPQGKLVGVITMRDLLFSDTKRTLAEIMLTKPFSLQADSELVEAMKSVLNRHFPVYPVCDSQGHLVGLLRGQEMFEAQAIELSAQAGSMVGVEKEERVSTPWQRSLLFRHPWLQLNLLTAFVAAFVVGIFEGTIEQIVVLAVFLPVLAGQSGNTGCQALAVTLRGMTLGEIPKGSEGRILFKEGLLGLLNGALVGLTAGLGMFVYASMQKNSDALMLAFVVFLSMIGACIISGVCGVLTPLVLKRLGADPATASSIFLTTFTDVASMGTFLGLATWLIL
ncbi:MAG: magnesium transporter [Terrimicrobiaceae bacterium]